MRIAGSAVLLLCLAVTSVAPPFAKAAEGRQDEKPKRPGQAHPDVDQDRVDKAIEKGAKFLLGQVGALGKVNHPHGGTIGTEEIVLYTLVHSDVNPSNKKFQGLVDAVLDKPLKKTYEVSLRAMALEALDRNKYQKHIAQCAQWLADNQCRNGQWGYGKETPVPRVKKPPKDVATQTGGAFESDTEIIRNRKKRRKGSGKTKVNPVIRIPKRRDGPPTGDNSNSQYAALGVRACMRAGCEIDRRVILKGLEWWTKRQKSDGGWGYNFKGMSDTGSWGSMSAGAVGSAIIYSFWLRQNYERNPVVRKGLKWIADNFTIKENPKYPQPSMWHLYWLYAVERVGMLYGTEKFGRHEWYPKGANWLLDIQKGNGSWAMPRASLGGEVADTCFAILFLRRATAPLKPVASGGGRKKK